MSENERNEIDQTIISFTTKSFEVIQSLQKKLINKKDRSHQRQHHRQEITYILEMHLHRVINEAKRLQSERQRIKGRTNSRLLPDHERRELAKKTLLRNTTVKLPTKENDRRDSLPAVVKAPAMTGKAIKLTTPMPWEIDDKVTDNYEKETYVEEEERKLEKENIMLQRRIYEGHEQARQMETRIAEISELFGHLTQELTYQHENIETIYENALTSRENIIQGNKELVKAQEYGSNFGFFIFCFYFGSSALLLFFHYFIP